MTVGMRTTLKAWPVADPFVHRRVAAPSDIDGFNHVNNARYIDWANEIAWAHSDALGLSMEDYRRLGTGCVVWRHEFDYVAPVMLGDAIDVATWIAANDNRVRLTRAYEMRNAATGRVVFRGRTVFVSIDMASGKPARMPKEFIDAYKPAERA
ncbi:MAG: acyl-CoA thioesterase [Parvularculaceae bacterium]